jgi:TIR domain
VVARSGVLLNIHSNQAGMDRMKVAVAHKKRCKVFVSYSRHDEALVRPLAGILGAATEDAVFLDVTSIKPGDRSTAEIEAAVRASSVFILCWCCECEKSGFVKGEIEIALESNQKRLVPVLLCNTPLPSSIADRQWVDLRWRVVHSCNHPENCADALGNALRNTNPSLRSHPWLNPSRLSLVVGAIAGLVFLGFLSVMSWPRPLQSPVPVGNATTICRFMDGPRAGQTEASSPSLPVGSVCEDENGSSGVVVEVRAMGIDPTILKIIRLTGLICALLLPVYLLWGGIQFVRSWKRRDANRLAALATHYFEALRHQR